MQTEFLKLALTEKVIEFGEFTLKSGRKSPYFFNLGKISDGQGLWQLAHCYAHVILRQGFSFDILFGPAYKGISLAAVTAVLLSQQLNKPVPFAYNRKEAKGHGEKGILVGPSLENKKVLVLDDVITAGTALKEVIKLLAISKAKLAGVVVAFNRQEKNSSQESSNIVNQLESELDTNIAAITSLSELIAYTQQQISYKHLSAPLNDYYRQYGSS